MPEKAPDLDGKRIRKLNSRWVKSRKTVQYVTLLMTVALILGWRLFDWPNWLLNLPIHLDPLLAFANLLAVRSIQAVIVLSLITLAFTFLFGRAWCGWICPLGTTIDLVTPGKKRKKASTQFVIPDNFRAIKFLLLISIFVLALLGNLTLLIFDPITIFIRSLTLSFIPALDLTITGMERFLSELPFTGDFIGRVDEALRPEIIPHTPIGYQNGWVFAFLLVAILSLNWIVPRFWCRYICPLGGILGLVSKGALFQRRVKLDCHQCGLCERSCPLGTIDPQRGFASDPAECTLCLECLPGCPRNSTSFAFGLNSVIWNDYDPDRRQFLSTIGLTALSAAVILSVPANQRAQNVLRPPGSNQDDLMSACLRCSACMRVCPTGALQPSLAVSGIEGLWTPILIPRLGYCDYSCNECGIICPVEAIPLLDLEEKRRQVIGKAYIDQNRCIAWADHQDCIVCEEMCPLPQKAIWLEPVQANSLQGDALVVQVPHVDRELCIGCGICEYKCPVSAQAAIQVFPV